MRVIGVDPGIVVTGFGIIDKKNNTIVAHSYGTVKPPKNMHLSDRLGYLYDEISLLLEKYKPNMLAVEDTFYSKNFKSAMSLGQARGAIILAGSPLLQSLLKTSICSLDHIFILHIEYKLY